MKQQPSSQQRVWVTQRVPGRPAPPSADLRERRPSTYPRPSRALEGGDLAHSPWHGTKS